MRWQNGSVRLQKRRKGIKMMLEYAKQERLRRSKIAGIDESSLSQNRVLKSNRSIYMNIRHKIVSV
jgi:hypothetical protein